MEPLSVASGIVGILTASGQLIASLYQLGSNINDAASDTDATVRELSDITTVVRSLQRYVLNQKRASPQRLQLITVEQITATLTGCIITYSELDKALGTLRPGAGMTGWDRAMWLLKKDKIATLILRLQNHKATFTMILNILQSQSMSDAEETMERLCDVVNEVLRSNRELALRLRNIEDAKRPLINTQSTNGLQYTGDGSWAATAGSQPEATASIQAINKSSTSSPTSVADDDCQVSSFEELLQRSRVYSRAADNDSLFSNDARSTLALSICSSLTLGEISNISVYALPVYATELSNAVFYTRQETAKGLLSEDRGIGRRPVPIKPSTNAQPVIPVRVRMRHILTGRGSGVTRSHPVFGVPLRASIRNAGTAVFLGTKKKQTFFGYAPVIVVECGIFMKKSGLDKENIFAQSGNPQTIRKLQAVFDSPDKKYGKSFNWTGCTPYDAASILLRYLMQLPEPLIPLELYESFRDPFKPSTDADPEALTLESAVEVYRAGVRRLPLTHRPTLICILDLLAAIASCHSENKMSASTIAAVFQPVLLHHPAHENVVAERNFSRLIVHFLIVFQDTSLIGQKDLRKFSEIYKQIDLVPA